MDEAGDLEVADPRANRQRGDTLEVVDRSGCGSRSGILGMNCPRPRQCVARRRGYASRRGNLPGRRATNINMLTGKAKENAAAWAQNRPCRRIDTTPLLYAPLSYGCNAFGRHRKRVVVASLAGHSCPHPTSACGRREIFGEQGRGTDQETLGWERGFEPRPGRSPVQRPCDSTTDFCAPRLRSSSRGVSTRCAHAAN